MCAQNPRHNAMRRSNDSRSRTRGQRLEIIDRLRRGPVGRSDGTRNLASLVVDQYRQRQAIGSECAHQGEIGIDIGRQPRSIVTLQKGRGIGGRSARHVDGDDCQPPISHRALQFGQCGKLFHARSTPCCPEIEQNVTAFERGERVLLPIGAVERHSRSSGSLFCRYQPRQGCGRGGRCGRCVDTKGPDPI